jgi:hypothetical protein
MKMKRILLITGFLLSALTYAAHAQILNDEGPQRDPNVIELQYNLQGSKWNTTALKYYIYNSSNSLTANERESIIQSAFQRWSAVSALTFTQVFSPASADIKLQWATGTVGAGYVFANNVLAVAYYPPPGGGNYAGSIYFNDAYTWSAGTGGSGYSLLHVAMHEIGHALGLEHSNVAGAVLNPSYSGITTLGSDDILGIISLYGKPSISGPVSVCPTVYGTYTISHSSAGTTYVWDKSPNVVTVSSSGGSAVFSAANINGSSGWVRVLVNGVEVARKTIYAGIPNDADIVATASQLSYRTFIAHVQNPSQFGATLVGWSVSGTDWSFTQHPAYPNLPMEAILITGPSYAGSSAYVWLEIQNACGYSSFMLVATLTSGYSSMSAYPNPVSDILTVDITVDQEALSATLATAQLQGGFSSTLSQNPTFQIKLYNSAGTLVKQTISQAGPVTLDVSSLPSGTYFLQVYDGTQSEPLTQTIIVSH